MRPRASTTERPPAGLQAGRPWTATQWGPGASKGAAKLPATAGSVPPDRAGTPAPHAPTAATTAATATTLRIATPRAEEPFKGSIPPKGAADDHPVAIRQRGAGSTVNAAVIALTLTQNGPCYAQWTRPLCRRARPPPAPRSRAVSWEGGRIRVGDARLDRRRRRRHAGPGPRHHRDRQQGAHRGGRGL